MANIDHIGGQRILTTLAGKERYDCSVNFRIHGPGVVAGIGIRPDAVIVPLA
jgi:hypothetical protein